MNRDEIGYCYLVGENQWFKSHHIHISLMVRPKNELIFGRTLKMKIPLEWIPLT